MSLATSVIVSTYNGAHKISRLLNALLLQSVSTFELIVVVDGSTDNTLEILKEFESKFPTLKIIVQRNGGRAKVKNRGAQEASGNLLIFYDDDMEPNDVSVQRHIEFHAVHANSVVSGNALELTSAGKTDFQNYRAWLTQHWVESFSDGVNQLQIKNCFLTAANMSVSALVFKQVGGFNENLNDAEDQDFALRCLKTNISVFFDRGNVAIHHDLMTCTRYIHRIRQYSAAHSLLRKLHPEITSIVSPDQNSIKNSFYWLFTFRFWRHAIEKNYFIFLPQYFRYKIYSATVHALGVLYPNTRL